jgi:hypothetical protein
MTNTQTQPEKITFLNEWTPEQFNIMQLAIRYYFKNKWLRTRHGNHFFNYPKFAKLGEILGLAYTSTGVWACYGVCNTEAYFDLRNVYQYSYFVMDKNNHCYAILQDKDENELVITL